MKKTRTEFMEFEPEEYRVRRIRTAQAMERAGIDALLLTNDHNLRWLTGFYTILRVSPLRSFAAAVPMNPYEEPTLLVPPDCIETPQTWVEDVRWWGEKELFAEESLSLISVFREKGLEKAVVGTELGRGMQFQLPLHQFEEIRKGLPLVEFVDIVPVMCELRAVKSEAEIEKIRTACKITCKVYEEAFQVMRAGMKERDLNRWLRAHFLLEGGSDGWIDSISGPLRHKRPNTNGGGNRAFVQGDIVVIDGGCVVDGYFCDINRNAVVGSANGEQQRISEAVRRANERARSKVRAGVSCAEIYRAAAESYAEDGLAEILPTGSIGHGLGLAIHEYPDIAQGSNQKLETRMVVCIEPWIYSDRIGLYNCEDVVLVMEEGCETLTPLPRHLRVVEA